jgi:transglutaminase-like putative cysteine protease
MLIRVGFEVALDFVKPSPVVLMPYIHPSRVSTIRRPERLTVNPPVPVSEYTDLYGNRCARAVVPAGCVTFRNDALVENDGRPDVQVPNAYQLAVHELPDDVLLYLLASRYCEVDSELRDTAWSLFGKLPAGWPLVQAVCNFVHEHIRFDYSQARANRTALDVFRERVGVCRDYMHLAITFCRSLNIPARYCTGYLGDIGVPRGASPMDFSAWFEVFLDGRWFTFDARHNVPRIGRIVIARGRDAADVAISTHFGNAKLTRFNVLTEEAVSRQYDVAA